MIDGQTNKDVGFKAEVLHLLESKGIAYTAEGLRISFPANNLIIILVPQETLPNPEMLPSSHSMCQWEQKCPKMLPSSHSACQWEQKRPEMLPSSHSACQWEQQCFDMNAAGDENPAEKGYDVEFESTAGDRSAEGNGSGKDTVYLYEDRWRCARSVTSQRILARLGKFQRIHARLCNVVSAENCKEHGLSPEAFNSKVRKFLDTYHTYGYLKGQTSYLLLYKNDIIAAAQFKQTYQPHSNKTIRSLEFEGKLAGNPGKNCQVLPQKEGPGRKYEWTRYASLPDVRIAGGMGKVLEEFVRDVRSKHAEEGFAKTKFNKCRQSAKQAEAGQSAEFEVMSYSDNEWSDGDAYRKLGFELVGSMPPVTYRIDPKTFNRINPRQWETFIRKTSKEASQAFKLRENQSTTKPADYNNTGRFSIEQYPVIRNLGSRKWVKVY